MGVKVGLYRDIRIFSHSLWKAAEHNSLLYLFAWSFTNELMGLQATASASHPALTLRSYCWAGPSHAQRSSAFLLCLTTGPCAASLTFCASCPLCCLKKIFMEIERFSFTHSCCIWRSQSPVTLLQLVLPILWQAVFASHKPVSFLPTCIQL